MSFRRRDRFPGIDPRATQELLALQDDLAADSAALRAEAIGQTTDTKQRGTYAVRFNERVRCLAGAAGLDLNFPGATPQTQNKWIEVLKIGGGDVRCRPIGGTIQGAASLTLTTAGFYYFQSDGLNGWWIQPIGGGGGGGESLAATLLIGNSTGGTDVVFTAGDALVVGGTPGVAGQILTSGGPGVSPGWAAAPGGGGLTLSTTEVNLGTGGVSGSFTIVGVGLTPGRPVLCVQAVGPYTGKGSLEDVAEEPVWCTAVVTSAVLITVYWQSSRPVGGNVKFNYAVG